MTQPLTHFAVEEYAQRKRAALRMLTNQQWDAATANAQMAPWLAICAAIGAQMGELTYQVEEIAPNFGKPLTCRLRSSDICAGHIWRAALARARDAALVKHPSVPADPAQRTPAEHRTAMLTALAAHLRATSAPPPHQQQERKAA